jgi:pimeloyl-ACP methyl ester carboxylesterase
MPAVERPDGAKIHWQAQGEGPRVLVTHHSLWSYPGVYAGLIADLAGDHEVVVYDPRGCGRSSERGPYDAETDAADLLAVMEAVDGAAVAIAVGDGFNRVARVAATRPDLISDVIAIGPAAAAVLPRTELRDSEVLAGSDAMIEMILQMMETNPRSALRTLIVTINPDLDEAEQRERVERVSDYLSAEAASERTRAWLDDDVSEQTRTLGDRLWILHGGMDPLFEGALRPRVVELFPKANLEQVEDGPISRPDLTAARVRRLTGRAQSRR